MCRMTVVVIVVLMCMGGAAWGGDIVAVPIGDMAPQGQYEVHYIYWDMDSIPTPGGPIREHINVLEVFADVTDDLEKEGIDTVASLHVGNTHGNDGHDNIAATAAEFKYSADDHDGLTLAAFVWVKIIDGAWQLVE